MWKVQAALVEEWCRYFNDTEIKGIYLNRVAELAATRGEALDTVREQRMPRISIASVITARVGADITAIRAAFLYALLVAITAKIQAFHTETSETEGVIVFGKRRICSLTSSAFDANGKICVGYLYDPIKKYCWSFSDSFTMSSEFPD